MKKLKLVKAIIRYKPAAFQREFVGRNPIRGSSERYLLLKKAADEYFPENIGKWECVGGIIKPKETSIETITRKMTEETGLEKKQFKIIRQLPTLKSDKNRCNVYLIDVASMNVRLSNEHIDYKWVKSEDVQKQDLVLYVDLLLEFFNNPKKYLN